MGKVAAFRQAHAEDGVARLQQRQIHCDVGLGPGMGLYVDMLGTVDLLRAVNGNSLYFIHKIASAVIACSGISLCIFVCQMAAHGFHDCLADKVFRCNQLNVIPLPLQLSHH